MANRIPIDWPNCTDEQLRLLRDYGNTPKTRRRAREVLMQRSRQKYAERIAENDTRREAERNA